MLLLLCIGLPELEMVVVMPFCMDKEDIDISSIPNRLDLECVYTSVWTHLHINMHMHIHA